MLAESPILNVEQLCQLALPLGSTLVAGSESLWRPVRWALTINAEASLPWLEGGEFILIVPGEVPNHLVPTITACAHAGTAAIGLLPPISPMTVAEAENLHMPIVQLPTGSRLRDIERTIIGLLLDREGHIERRSAQIYQQLVQLASANVGLEHIIHELGKIIHKGVVVQDKRLHIQVAAVPPALAGEWDQIADWLCDRNMLPDSLRDRHKLPRHTSPAVRQPFGSLMRLITPVVNQDIGRGYLSF
ncbi:MAG TPA: PucR family transcriptional regulator ligand-binding domain-containing protein, partial [Aggregatilineales bacterium]|nr:PucR family transcriptional regulator ligand-binding domain-containing protein [Aggregatilineales bacterium]